MTKDLVNEQEALDKIKVILREELPRSSSAYLFGSRATGKARPYSDVDIALDYRGQTMPEDAMTKLRTIFEFSDLPYKVDIVDLHAISDNFRAAIQSELVKLL